MHSGDQMVQRLFSPSAAQIAGNVATFGFLVAIVLQLLLALGIVPVTMAWGGTQSVLTTSLQLTSVVAAGILGGFAYVIRRRAGLGASVQLSKVLKILAWVITLYLALNTLGNFASSSTGEAMLFGPISLIVTLACLIVSASRADSVES
jgi:hypothetical protein